VLTTRSHARRLQEQQLNFSCDSHFGMLLPGALSSVLTYLGSCNRTCHTPPNMRARNTDACKQSSSSFGASPPPPLPPLPPEPPPNEEPPPLPPLPVVYGVPGVGWMRDPALGTPGSEPTRATRRLRAAWGTGRRLGMPRGCCWRAAAQGRACSWEQDVSIILLELREVTRNSRGFV
jgi:hypothetical protein